MSKQDNPDDAREFAPFDVQVEAAVLGSLMRYPEFIPVALAELTPADFYDPFHTRIFERIVLFDDDDRPATPLTLGSSLKNDPAGLEIAGSAQDEVSPAQAVRRYLAQMTLAAPSSSPPMAEYCRILVDHRERREARQAIEDAEAELYRGDMVPAALGRVVEVADRITLRAQLKRSSASFLEVGHALAKDVERASQSGKLAGCPSGSARLDHQVGGFMAGDLVVLAGRPGMGKSVLGLQFARHAGSITDGLNREYDPTIFSLEMSSKENAARVIAELDYDDAIRDGRKPLQYSQIIKGRLKDDQWERYVALTNMLGDFGIEVHDESRMSMQKIASIARARAQLSTRKPWVLIDHLQIVGSPARSQGNRVQDLTEITGQAKALAKRIGAPVIALSQLNRGVEAREDKRPNLGDLRESGSIEQDADVVLMLYRPEYYLRRTVKHAQATKAKNVGELEAELERKANVLEIEVAKNRSGGTGDVEIFIDVASSAVRDKRPEYGEVAPRLALGTEPLDGLADLDKQTGGKT